MVLYCYVEEFLFVCSHKRHMEDRTENQKAVKVEKHSQSVILTYFHGDTNSMVDAHFSRALGFVSKDKGPAKTKKTRKSLKSGKKAHPCGDKGGRQPCSSQLLFCPQRNLVVVRRPPRTPTPSPRRPPEAS